MPSPAPSSFSKSTNVRFNMALMAATRPAFGLLASASPEWAERWAERTFCRTPPAQEPSPRAKSVLSAAFRFEVESPRGKIAVWRWGRGPAVLLMHGWGGRASQMTSFAAPLVAAGASAVAFDAPGHGASPGGSASLLSFADALEAVAGVSGPILGVLGHSLGAAAASFAVGHRGLDVPRLALVAPPSDPERYFLEHLGRLGVEPARRSSLSRRLARRLGCTWGDFFVPAQVRRFGRPVLVIHDREDRETSWHEGEAIARASAQAALVTTSGLGHRRILRDGAVVEGVVSFFAAPLAGASASTLSTHSAAGGVQ